MLQQARAFGTENNILLGSNNQTTSEVLYGTSSGDNIIAYGGMSDQVYGYAGDDILFGGNGLDKLYGGIGNDSYYFNSGDAIQIGASHYEDSFDQVNENRNEGLDVIYFARGIHPDAVLLWTDGTGSLFIKYSETDIIRIKGSITGESGAYYTSRVSEHLEQIIFDDETVWDLTQGLYLRNEDYNRSLYGSAMNDTIIGGAVTDHLYGFAGDDVLIGGSGNSYLFGGNGNDTLSGGGGTDQMSGEAGDDTYILNLGDSPLMGHPNYESSYDRINENLNEGFDTLRFGAGINPEDLYLWTDNTGALFIRYSDTDIVRIKGSITGQSGASQTNRVGQHLEQIIFDDETVWDLTQGLHLRNENTGRTIYGSAYNDTIQGGSATDHLYGFAGDDILYGYDATDYLFGGEGQDILYGGTGNDTLRGENGNDTLYGGSGVDTLYGGAGSDRFVFESDSAFSNVDTIADFSLAQNDVIDISDLLALYDPLSHAITDFVSITQSGSNSALFVDRDGAGAGYGAQQIATISGVTGITDVAALIANGHLDITP